jgi:hypothetical protein
MFEENPEEMEYVLCDILGESISIRDTFSRDDLRENFYHGFILGLLQPYREVYSNRESGDGYPDVIVINKKLREAAILEFKYADSDDLHTMEKACNDALAQIENTNYASNPRFRVMKQVKKYGISFNKKTACVRM